MTDKVTCEIYLAMYTGGDWDVSAYEDELTKPGLGGPIKLIKLIVKMSPPKDRTIEIVIPDEDETIEIDHDRG